MTSRARCRATEKVRLDRSGARACRTDQVSKGVADFLKQLTMLRLLRFERWNDFMLSKMKPIDLFCRVIEHERRSDFAGPH